jgi:putative copper export protein
VIPSTVLVIATAGDTITRALHLIGGAVFAGGMVMLGMAAAAARKTVPPEVRIELFRVLGRRFLIVGGVALLVAIGTGIDMASDRDVWGNLTDTTYGKTLLAKIILVGVVVVLTAFHSLVQGPRLSSLRHESLSRPDDAALEAKIRRSAAQAGIVSMVNLLATLAILVLAARLLTI